MLATVLATVIGSSNLDYFVIDAGYKTFGKGSLITYKEELGFFWKGSLVLVLFKDGEVCLLRFPAFTIRISI